MYVLANHFQKHGGAFGPSVYLGMYTAKVIRTQMA